MKLVLIGFMGTGKTAVGRLLAGRLGLRFLDVDAVVEAQAGCPVAEIFRRDGEVRFRDLEREAIAGLRDADGCLIAPGGGAVLDPVNWANLKSGAAVVCLTADPDAILARVGMGRDRPLLAGGDRRDRIVALLRERMPLYARADLTVDTTWLPPPAVAARIITELVERGLVQAPVPRAVPVSLGSRSYQVLIGPGLLDTLGTYCQPLRLSPRIAVITHPALQAAYGQRAVEALGRAGFDAALLPVPEGEGSKSLAEAGRLYDALLDLGLDRGSGLVALGGGVIGDLGGFVAATFLRGLSLVQIPTTLLAQVDSSIGGKVGVNLPRAKNAVGAFYQPRLVLADMETLETLPEREFRSGLAEVVKYGMIADPDLFRVLEEGATRLLARETDLLAEVVARSAAIKAAIVTGDETERGQRAVLNFGHTVGHALEATLGYGALTHGEAVAIGMVAATQLSIRRGLCPPAVLPRLCQLLESLGLPIRPPSVPESLLKTVTYDKKVRGGTIQFVLTCGVGSVTVAPVSDLKEIEEALLSEAP